MKIMHGMREIAGQAYYSAYGLRKSGYDAKVILWDESAMKYPYDYCMGMDQGKKYMYPIYAIRVFVNFLVCAAKYDTFHFHFGHSLLPKNLDLPILKLLKKNIFMEFHGSDLRQKSIALGQNPYWKYYQLTNEDNIARRAKRIAKYAKGLILHDDELIPHVPKATRVFVVPLRLDLDKFTYKYPDADKSDGIKIVHAPSNRGGKGTHFINTAISELSSRYNIDYEIIEGLTQEEALKKYVEADIVVDQLLTGTYGVFSIEAMAMGKPVLVYISDEMKECLPEDLPLVSASPDNIKEKLEELITNGQMRNSLGVAGREYALKYHDCCKNGKYLGEIYEGRVYPATGREAFDAVTHH